MADLTSAWAGAAPYDILLGNRSHHRQVSATASTPASRMHPLVRTSSSVAKTIDVWNTSFFHGRKLEMVLYRGLERRSGLQAGRKGERLRREVIPPQYQAALVRRKTRRPVRGSADTSEDDEDDDGDSSSLTSSSTSGSGSDDDSGSDDSDSDSEDGHHRKHRKHGRDRVPVGSQHILQTPYPTRARRNSLAAQVVAHRTGDGGDGYESWVVKNREAIKFIGKRQKLEKKMRRLERRQRRKALMGEPLYSVWMAHIR